MHVCHTPSVKEMVITSTRAVPYCHVFKVLKVTVFQSERNSSNIYKVIREAKGYWRIWLFWLMCCRRLSYLISCSKVPGSQYLLVGVPMAVGKSQNGRVAGVGLGGVPFQLQLAAHPLAGTSVSPQMYQGRLDPCRLQRPQHMSHHSATQCGIFRQQL